MFHTSRQLKDQIRNLSTSKGIESHILIRNYMTERFLERISLTTFRDKFILKGGMLVTAMVGIGSRATMDVDTTLKGAPLTVESIKQIFEEIIKFQINDGVEFQIKKIVEIMEEAEYPGIRVSMEALFDGVRTPLKIDISTGDVITPNEVSFEIPLMFENRKIPVWAYNLETVLAEKMETIIVRNVTNTRMRDLYDIFILQKLYAEHFDLQVFSQALDATASHRGPKKYLSNISEILDEIEQSTVQKNLWISYQKNFSYANSIAWEDRKCGPT